MIIFEPDVFYYHPAHLGSTTYVTDLTGEVYQHLEYFPFGETWVEEVSNRWRVPYLFTAKELDRETGLYYFGARYYDPRTSVWQSADPEMAAYLDGSHSAGVYSSINLSLYTYSYANPLIYTDPDGRFVFVVPLALLAAKAAAFGVAYVGVQLAATPARVAGDAESVEQLNHGINTAMAMVAEEQGKQVAAAFIGEGVGRAAGAGYKALKGLRSAGRVASEVAGQSVSVSKSVAPKVGDKVTRHWGGKSGPNGQSWTRDPLPQHTRDSLGLGQSNTGEYITQGRLKDTTGVTTRRAQPWDGFKGGGDEVLVPNPAKQ